MVWCLGVIVWIVRHVISVLIRLLHGRVLGAHTFTLLIACKPFFGCMYPNRPAMRVMVAIRSLSLFTNRADRRSQINSLDS